MWLSDFIQPFQGWLENFELPQVAKKTRNLGLCYSTPLGSTEVKKMESDCMVCRTHAI